MSSKILINAVDTEECRIAKVKDSRLEEFHVESASHEITHGNIYKGVITRIEPSLQAAFVDYGAERHGFLQQHEIHCDYFQSVPNNGDLPITQMVKRGQELLVQVVKDPILNKGAMLTTHLSLPGRFVVLMPGSENRGISRKIEDETERSRLKEIVHDVKLQEKFGLIIRTAGVGCTKTLINKDSAYLTRLWQNIKSRVMQVETPSLLYKERNLAVRSIRDYFTPDVSEILIDDETVYQEIKEFMKIISPKHAKLIKRHKGLKPIFTKFQLEEQIASIFENRVKLKSGGSIVIDPTEALVAIDVNSGKATQGKSIEQTALQTNLEAAEEVARQLRMRDLGGLIVVDFIDMRESGHKNNVEKTLKSHLKSDKAKTKVGRISQFGLLEMSRQRLRPSIEFGRFETCGHCRGRGLIPSTELLSAGFLRRLSLETIKSDIRTVTGIVPHQVADYLLNNKRNILSEMETNRGIRIVINGDPDMVPGESHIVATPAPSSP